MPGREFPLVIRKNGDKVVPTFPVQLDAGDQIVIVKELRGSMVPEKESWYVSGYTLSGPIITKL